MVENENRKKRTGKKGREKCMTRGRKRAREEKEKRKRRVKNKE